MYQLYVLSVDTQKVKATVRTRGPVVKTHSIPFFLQGLEALQPPIGTLIKRNPRASASLGAPSSLGAPPAEGKLQTGIQVTMICY